MILYFLLNLVLVIIIAGLLPTVAGAVDPDSKVEALRRAQEALRRAVEDAGHAFEAQKEIIEAQSIPAYEKQIAVAETELAVTARSLDIKQQLIKRYQEEIKLVDKTVTAGKRRAEMLEKEIEKLQESQRAEVEKAKALEKTVKASKAAAIGAENIGAALGSIIGISDAWKNSIVGSFIAAGESGASFGQTLSAVGQKLGQQFGPLNLIGNLVGVIQERTWELAKAQEATIASVNRQTSAFGQYNDQIITINIEQRHLGIGVEEVGEAYATLHNTVTDFSRLQPRVQKKLATTAARLEKVGVESHITAQFLQEATKSLGMTAEQAEATTRELAGFAKELGISVNKAMSDFARHARDMAKFGSQAKDVFKSLTAAEKESGIAMEEMMRISEQFTLFPGAAKAVGDLASLMGGKALINDMSLFHASITGGKGPVEAMKLLQYQLTKGGTQLWDPDDFAMNRAIAKAVGVDVATLGKIWVTNFDKATSATDAQSVSQQVLTEMIKDTQTISEKWDNVLKSLAISMRPVVKLVGMIVDKLSIAAGWLNKLSTATDGWGSALSLVLGLGLIYFFGVVALKMVAASTSMLGIASASKPFAAGVSTIGKALVIATPGMLSFGLATVMVGTGIGVVIGAIGYMVDAFARLGAIDAKTSLWDLAQGLTSIVDIGLTGALVINAIAGAMEELKEATTGTSLGPFTHTIRAVTKFEAEAPKSLPATTLLVQKIQAYAEAEQSFTMTRIGAAAGAAVKGVLPAPRGAQKVYVENLPSHISLFVEPNVELQAYIEGVVEEAMITGRGKGR